MVMHLLGELNELMKIINFSEENCVASAGELNVFFDSKRGTKGDKPSLKQKPVAKLLELKKEFDLYLENNKSNKKIIYF